MQHTDVRKEQLWEEQHWGKAVMQHTDVCKEKLWGMALHRGRRKVLRSAPYKIQRKQQRGSRFKKQQA
jgi:hypothetical protein